MKGVRVKRAALAALAIIVIVGFAWALRERPTLVDVARVLEAPMRVTVRDEGVTRVRDTYTVSAPIGGHLTRTVLDEGDRVEAGRTIVASIRPLDPPLIDRRTKAELLASRDAARSAVGIAEIELKRAETGLRLAEDEMARALKLYGPGIISESAVQKITNVMENQRAAVDAACATIGFRQAELASAEARLLQSEPSDPEGESCCVNLLAPVDGIVLAVLATSEQPVLAGAKIAEVGDTSDLRVVVDILSADAVRLSRGTKAMISDWGGESQLAATVQRIDPAAFTKVSALGIEEQRVKVTLELEHGDPRLGHDYRVFVELAIWECDRCLQVPISALFRSGSEWNVFIVEGDRLRQAVIDVGNMNDEVAEVLDGVAPGDIVVVHPGDTLGEGSLVERRKD